MSEDRPQLPPILENLLARHDLVAVPRHLLDQETHRSSVVAGGATWCLCCGRMNGTLSFVLPDWTEEQWEEWSRIHDAVYTAIMEGETTEGNVHYKALERMGVHANTLARWVADRAAYALVDA